MLKCKKKKIGKTVYQSVLFVDQLMQIRLLLVAEQKTAAFGVVGAIDDAGKTYKCGNCGSKF